MITRNNVSVPRLLEEIVGMNEVSAWAVQLKEFRC